MSRFVSWRNIFKRAESGEGGAGEAKGDWLTRLSYLDVTLGAIASFIGIAGFIWTFWYPEAEKPRASALTPEFMRCVVTAGEVDRERVQKLIDAVSAVERAGAAVAPGVTAALAQCNFAAAETVLLEDAQTHSQSGETADAVANYIALGDLLQTRDPTGALEMFEKALALAPDDPGALGRIAFAKLNQGDDAAAQSGFLKALANLKADSDPRNAVGLRRGLAHVYAYRNQFEAAFATLSEARAIAEKSGDHNILRLLYWAYADTHARMGNMTETKEYLRKAIAEAEACACWRDAASYASTLGQMEVRANDLAAAKAAFEAQGTYADKDGAADLKAYALNTRGMVAALGGDPESALNLYTQSVTILREVGAVRPLVATLWTAATVETQLNRLDKARETLTEAMRMARLNALPDQIGYAGESLGDLAVRAIAPAEACTHWREAERGFAEAKMTDDTARLKSRADLANCPQ